jgi:hypothetical protein
MASTFQQRSRIRKGIYAGLILLLFTASYLYRENLLLGQANSLGLREETQGQVALSDSAIRLSLTGSKGLACCFLWIAARDKQMRHEWGELEMLTDSVAKLQPHFITPWLFQSWNIAFNVAVECDSPHDKYYYIARGTQLLVEGERRNRGRPDPNAEIVFPGNPDLRFHLGLFYQMKIGLSDENRTMRSLFQMSCMNPAERNPAVLFDTSSRQRKVNSVEFEKFCMKHPRLVRRLREELHLHTPENIVEFLAQHQDVPCRYEPITDNSRPKEATLFKENARDRYPIMPPRFKGGALHDEDDRDASPLGDDFDQFGAAREWFIFAQEPLPPCDPDFSVDGWHYDTRRYRTPKMTHYIFRQYPALAESRIAEKLAEEGWFDTQGWALASRGELTPWFTDANGSERKLVLAKGLSNYSSNQARRDAYRRLLDYGNETGLLMPELPAGNPLKKRYRKLEHQREMFLEQQDKRKGQNDPALAEDARAALILERLDYYRRITNCRSHFYEFKAEQEPLAAQARKHYYEAEKLWDAGDRTGAMENYEEWIAQWKQLLERYPRYRENDVMQEDSYEQQLHYMRRYQEHHKEELKVLFLALAQSALRLPDLRVSPLRQGVATVGLGASPFLGAFQGLPWAQPKLDLPAGLPRLLTREQKDRIIPSKQIHGPFDGGEEGNPDIPFFDPDVVAKIRQRVMYPVKGSTAPPKKLPPPKAGVPPSDLEQFRRLQQRRMGRPQGGRPGQ